MTPASVSLAPGESTNALVIVSNGTDQAVPPGTLSVPTDDALRVELVVGDKRTSETVVPGLSPGAQYAVDVEVARRSDGLPAGALPFRWDAGTGASIAVGSLTVTDRVIEVTAASVEVTTMSSGSRVDEMNPQTVFLVIENASASPVEVCGITVTTPEGIDAVPEPGSPEGDCAETDKKMLPGDAYKVAYRVKATGEVRPGHELAVFDVLVAMDDAVGATRRIESHVIASAEIETAVFGEAWALAVGVPVFFLLPGFLVLVAMSMTAQWLKALKVDSTSWIRKPVDPQFLVIAVSVSAATALVLYPWLTDWFGIRRSYLDGYAFTDILYVWTGSILVGALAGTSWAWGAKWRRDKRRRESIEVATTPLGLLEYMARTGIGFRRPRMNIDGYGEEVVVLVSRDLGADEFWASPRIGYGGEATAVAQLTNALDSASADDVVKMLKRDSGITLSFVGTKLTRPTKFQIATAKPRVLSSRELILEKSG